MRPRRNGQAGFTLPEVLIALALLAVIASLLVNAIASARLALQATDRQATLSTVPAVQAVLRRLMTEVRPGPETSERPDADRAFVGARDQVSFISSFVPQGQFGGLWRYDLMLGQDGAAGVPGALVIAQRLLWPALPSLGPTAACHTHRPAEWGPRSALALFRRSRWGKGAAMVRGVAAS